MIPNDFNTAHADVVKLVKTFADSHDKYLAPDYNESAARKDFIDKFFIALGWDVNHDTQTNPYEQEVKVERNVAVAARVKKADYAFFLKPDFQAERFFVEAKRPSATLDTLDNCFQTIRYAFSSSRARLSILTNFKELYVMDCRFRPDVATATKHVHKKYHFEDFADADKFAEVYYLFGRDAVADGSLEKYADTLPKPKGKGQQRKFRADTFQEIDDAFLAKLEEYRNGLAKMFKRKNAQLTSDDLTEAVQRTLDRLVFIRFLEDKLIEPTTILDKFGDKPHPWRQFIAKSRDFDKTYNGIIFKQHPIIDADDFVVDDKVFLSVCDDFADKYTPYHFNYIPIHILGSIYERFLGNVIVATASRARIEAKPEVRKAGGVFYTPQYIVNYIVENTVGALLKSSSPYARSEVDAASADGVVLSSNSPPGQEGWQPVSADGVVGLKESESNPNKDSGAFSEQTTPSAKRGHLSFSKEGSHALSSPPGQEGWQPVSADGVVDLKESESNPNKDSGAFSERTTPSAKRGHPSFSKEGSQIVTPADVARMRFADIACGSGSFLLGVYEYLLRWHTKYYNQPNNKKEAREAGCKESEDGTFHLSFEQKKKILVNNVYGVDIDRQAYEVTQLSLFLKLLEEETLGSVQPVLGGYREALLPSLANNIVCGNALVDWDISSGDLFEQLDEDNQKRLNPLSFEHRFPKIMSDGGFDAIVGNPPYIRIQGFEKKQIEYFAKKYKSARGNFDIYVNFVERAFGLLKPDGMFGQIVPNKFFRTDYGIGLRGFLSKDKWINRIVDFGASQVFSVTIYTCLLFLKNNPSTSLEYSLVDAGPESLDAVKFMELKADNLDEGGWVFAEDNVLNLLRKLENNSTRLLDLPATMNRGSSSGCDDVFMVESQTDSIEPDLLRSPIFATDFNRYQFHENSQWRIIFPYKINADGYEVIGQKDLAAHYPLAYEYLKKNKATLEKRKGYQSWYGYSAPRSLNLHEHADILIPLLANKGIFALIPDDLIGKLCPMASGGFTITLGKETGLRREYLLGLLNSKLLFWKLRHLSNVFRGGWITCTKQYIGELPIHNISTDDQKAKHDVIVRSVEEIMKAKAKLAEARNDSDVEFWTNKCEKLESDINTAVYSLYALTPDEIQLVEG